MYVCTCVYVHVRTRARACSFAVDASIARQRLPRMRVCIHAYVCVCACVRACVRACACICACVRVYMRVREGRVCGRIPGPKGARRKSLRLASWLDKPNSVLPMMPFLVPLSLAAAGLFGNGQRWGLGGNVSCLNIVSLPPQPGPSTFLLQRMGPPSQTIDITGVRVRVMMQILPSMVSKAGL